jgi:hypothetical protein
MCGGGLAHKENNTLHMTMIKNGKIKIGGGGERLKRFFTTLTPGFICIIAQDKSLRPLF